MMPADAKVAVRRALEIGCVVHVCSALPGAMCKPNPDTHGPPSDMDPDKGPWYGVHHRRWLTWLKEGNRVLTAAEQVYACDVCDAPIDVPCIHMRGPGLGRGEFRGPTTPFPDGPLKVEGRIHVPGQGMRSVTMNVTDPKVIEQLKSGREDISVGWRPDPYEPRFAKTDILARLNVETCPETGPESDGARVRCQLMRAHDGPHEAKMEGAIVSWGFADPSAPASRTAGFDMLYGTPSYASVLAKSQGTTDGWKKIEPLTVDPGRDPEQLIPAGIIPFVPIETEKFTTPSREEWMRRQVGHALNEILAVPTTEPELLRRLVSKVTNLMSAPPVWVSGGAETLHYLETVEQETERFVEMLRQRDPKNPLLRHLRSVPMPENPDEIDTVVARPTSEADTKPINVPVGSMPHPFKPALVEDGVSCEDCGLPKEAHTVKMTSSLAWFKDQAKRALAVKPDITMMEFIERVGEPEYETAAQRAFHLDEGELEIALRNVGCDLRCGACAETFFTGSTDLVHRCAMLSKLKCALCEKPAVPKSQLCSGHERSEYDEIEGHIQANRELNGSSAETRRFAIARLNELDRHPSLYGHTLEGLCGVVVVLLQIAGVKPEQVNSFQQFFYATARGANERTPGPENDPYGEVIAHARGIVLGIQLLREGPQDAPSPLRLMMPKSPESKA